MGYGYRRYSSHSPLGTFFVGAFLCLFLVASIASVVITAVNFYAGLWLDFLLFIGFSTKSWPVLHHFKFSLYATLSIIGGVLLAKKFLTFKRWQQNSAPVYEVIARREESEGVVEKVRNEDINLLDYEFKEYQDSHGYTKVFVPEYKQRRVAEKILKRKLQSNEVVHHIDGVKWNNEPDNLCVMDRTRHEQFHGWMNWKKSKSSSYPDIDFLKSQLEGDLYKGILLERHVRDYESLNYDSKSLEYGQHEI